MVVAGARHDDETVDANALRHGRLGSPVGWIFVAAILCILAFAIFFDVRPGHVIDRLRPGMTPTEVAAILGVPRAESRTDRRLVQRWHLPEAGSLEVEYEDGRMVSKRIPAP
jgi:hypothetical protein